MRGVVDRFRGAGRGIAGVGLLSAIVAILLPAMAGAAATGPESSPADGSTEAGVGTRGSVAADRRLTVSVAGSGVVTSQPRGIYCGTRGTKCSKLVESGNEVTLYAYPETDYRFSSWTGCTAEPTVFALIEQCVVEAGEVANVTATFVVDPDATSYDLTVKYGGGGTGYVFSSRPPAINCGSICTHPFPSGTSVVLDALVLDYGTGSIFSGWSSSCSPLVQFTYQALCEILLTKGSTVTANYAQVMGSQAMSVTSAPATVPQRSRKTIQVRIENRSRVRIPDLRLVADGPGISGSARVGGFQPGAVKRAAIEVRFRKSGRAKMRLTATRGDLDFGSTSRRITVTP